MPAFSYLIIEQGRRVGPVQEDDLGQWRRKNCHIVYDTTENMLRLRHLDQRQPRSKNLGERVRHGLQPLFRTQRELLRSMLEHPTRVFSSEIFEQLTDIALDERTFTKYMVDLREFLGDRQSDHPFIKTVSGYDTSVSRTGFIYRLDPAYSVRVIRFWKEIFNVHTSGHGSVRTGA